MTRGGMGTFLILLLLAYSAVALFGGIFVMVAVNTLLGLAITTSSLVAVWLTEKI